MIIQYMYKNIDNHLDQIIPAQGQVNKNLHV